MPALLCNACDVITKPDRAPSECMKCGGALVVVDLAEDILACPGCAHFRRGLFNARARRKAKCPDCRRSLTAIHLGADPLPARAQPSPRPSSCVSLPMIYIGAVMMGVALFSVLALFLVLWLVPDPSPELKAEAVITAPVGLVAAWFLARSLRLDPLVRANHAIEHATFAVLQERGHELWEGHAEAEGFFAAGVIGRQDLETAAAEAIARLKGNDPDLRIHALCGGRFFVDAMVIGFSIALGLSAIVVTLSRPAWWPTLLIPLVLLVPRRLYTALLQRHLTTTADFASARVTSIVRTDAAFFVKTAVTME